MIYVTSDLHGCKLADFLALLKRAKFSDRDFLFVLGDVIDRGKHGVALLRWIATKPNVQLLLGNHERMLLACEFLFDEVTDETLARLDAKKMRLFELWMYNGGKPTLDGLRRLFKEDPEALEGLFDMLRDAPLYEELTVNGRYFVLVHGGLGNFHKHRPLSDYTADELTWERPTLHTRYYTDGTLVIFGHTPTDFLIPARRGKMVQTKSWICIDTGAAGGMPMLLRLNDLRPFY